ncbi:MAG: hypothetical protein ABIH55_03290 [Nanoarchaeota archaeon]
MNHPCPGHQRKQLDIEKRDFWWSVAAMIVVVILVVTYFIVK